MSSPAKERDVTDEEAEGVMALEKTLTDWMKAQPVSVEWSIIALGISAARLIYGVGALKGAKAGVDAARLLDTSVVRALRVFRR
jgi:hypothetical protein